MFFNIKHGVAEMNIVIIGNGIIGLTTAFRLASIKNINVVVVGDQTRIGSGSLAAGAMLNSFAEVDSDTFSSEIDRDRFEMSFRATKLWPEFYTAILNCLSEDRIKYYTSLSSKKFFDEPQNSTYIVNSTLADNYDEENFDSIVRALELYKQNFEIVNPANLDGYNPQQRYRATRAIRMEEEGWVSPATFIQMLEESLSTFKNVTFAYQNAIRLNVSSNKIDSLELSDGNVIRGDKYLLANGASYNQILTNSAIRLDGPKIFYGVGTSLEVSLSANQTHPNCIRTPNRGLACGTYTVPQGRSIKDGEFRVLLGATNYISHIPVYSSRVDNINSILRNVTREINQEFDKALVTKVNTGWRPTSSDIYPLIGQTTTYPSLYVCTGTKRDGWHLSPYISNFLTELIASEKTDKLMIHFKPERAPIKNINREQAIEKGVKHLMSAAYQHEFTPSGLVMESDLMRFYKSELEKLHDNIGAIDWGIPVELIGMYKYGHIK